MNSKKDDEKGIQYELRFYSGYKGDEVPRAVVIDNREFKIQEVVSRRRVLEQMTGRRFSLQDGRREGEDHSL